MLYCILYTVQYLHVLQDKLPVKQTITFKTLVLVYLTTGKPKYFVAYLSLYASTFETRCNNPEKIFIKISYYNSSIQKLKVHFNICFLCDAPKLWSDLPLDIQTAPTFKGNLKPKLFGSLPLLNSNGLLGYDPNLVS